MVKGEEKERRTELDVLLPSIGHDSELFLYLFFYLDLSSYNLPSRHRNVDHHEPHLGDQHSPDGPSRTRQRLSLVLADAPRASDASEGLGRRTSTTGQATELFADCSAYHAHGRNCRVLERSRPCARACHQPDPPGAITNVVFLALMPAKTDRFFFKHTRAYSTPSLNN